jgi:hypothetical protein
MKCENESDCITRARNEKAMNEASHLSAEVPSLWGSQPGDRSPSRWEGARRIELLHLFADNVYGRTPEGGGVADAHVSSPPQSIFDGLGTRSEIEVTLFGPIGRVRISLLLYLPRGASETNPAPAFLGLNFKGNHSTTHDPQVSISRGWMPALAARGDEARRWPIEMILARGYAVATAHNAELEPDRDGAAGEGVRRMFPTMDAGATGPASMWGTIGAWSWGLSRLLDVLQEHAAVDGSAVIAHGHSRLGKTALWAAAQDSRFAAVISNDSGCAGASLFRHKAGENVRMITETFPHWFTSTFTAFRDSEDTLPIDQHLLLAALLPRPVHVASASEDFHADPRGEYLSTLYASPIAELYGQRGTLPVNVRRERGNDIRASVAETLPFPPLDTRIGGRLSYHRRTGPHDVLAEDWKHFLDFADEQVVKRVVG